MNQHASAIIRRRPGGREIVSAFTCLLALCSYLAAAGRQAHAQAGGLQAEELVPAETKAFFSIADPREARAAWGETQLGKLLNEPLMKPFAEDARRQLEEKLSRVNSRLNLSWDDVEAVASGEVALAVIQPGPRNHAVLLLADATGNQFKVDALLARVAADLDRQRAVAQSFSDPKISAYVLPPGNGRPRQQRVYYGMIGGWVMATDHAATAAWVVDRLRGVPAARTLRDVKAYQQTSERCHQARGEQPIHVHWFIEPIGYARTVEAMDTSGNQSRRDYIEIFQQQGFDAITGIGGQIAFNVGGHQIVHREFVYLPSGQPKKLAARMLQFPNTQPPAPPAWVPGDAASCLALNWKLADAFEYSKTLINAIMDDEVFDDILESTAKDTNGPQLDLRKDVVAHLAQRGWLFTKTKLPVTTKSERKLLAFELTDPKTVAGALNRALKRDKFAQSRTFREQVIWEIFQRPEESAGPQRPRGFGGFGAPAQREGKRAPRPLIKNAAIAVVAGHLVFASDLELIQDMIVAASGEATGQLAEQDDFLQVTAALGSLGSDEVTAARYFMRLGQTFNVNYELLRQGKMPDSETLLGSFLNWILAPEEEDLKRPQEIDGSKMPPFDKLRGFFGTGGIYMRAESNGWFITGCTLFES